MEVRAGAEAAAARLDPEQVAEHRDDEVRVQQPARVADAERHDREPLALGVAEDAEVRVGSPTTRARGARSAPSRRRISLGADRLLEREHEPGADRLDDRGRARLLADDRVGVVGLPGRADEPDRPAARRGRHAPLRRSERFATRTPGRAGAAGELVRGEEDRVLAASCRSAGTGRRRRSRSRRARRGGGARLASASTSETIPVTFDAAEKLPTFSGRSAWRRSSASSCARSIRPSASSAIVTTSALDSRHGSSLEWCS